MSSSASQKPLPIFEKPGIEFLLKQVYAAHKEEVKILSDKLLQAKSKIQGKSPCSFCITLKEQIKNLRQELEGLLQEKQQHTSAFTKDASVQTDDKTSLPAGNKRTLKFSPPRKRLHMSQCKLEKSPTKNGLDEEVILAPSTPERNPQREARVRKWLQTMEIPETVDPFSVDDKLYFSSQIGYKHIGHKEVCEPQDTDETMLVCNHVGDKSHEDMDETLLRCNSVRDKVHEDKPDGCEPQDMDETMLPLSYFQHKNERHEELNHSSASSEDLLGCATIHKQFKNNVKILAEVGNRANNKLSVEELAGKQQNVPFKYKGEPVRKKVERLRLPGHQCAGCANFYEGERGDKQRELCSRHRAANVAPDTPENFWELDFPDTQVCKERGYMDITQKVKIPSRRRRPFKQVDMKTPFKL